MLSSSNGADGDSSLHGYDVMYVAIWLPTSRGNLLLQFSE